MNEKLYSDEEEEDTDDLVIQFDKEKDESIPLEEPQDEKYDIVNVGTNVLEKWAQVEGYSDTEIQGIKTKYVEWPSSLTDELVSDVGRDSSNDYIFWKKMATSTGWPSLANVASIITNIPAAEVENERIFGVKRRIVGKHSVRSKPITITARTRVIMKSQVKTKKKIS